jgi:chromate reductase, NAD(P)H dehydrogenase (quinone)
MQLIMRTLGAKLSEETTMLIPGIKGKINDSDRGEFKNDETGRGFQRFMDAFGFF